MTQYHFVIQPRAQSQLATARAWWAHNRDKAPSAFDDDFDAAVALLKRQPFAGVQTRSSRGRRYRRLLLERIRYYIYYRVTDTIIEIVAIWHASRRPPKL